MEGVYVMSMCVCLCRALISNFAKGPLAKIGKNYRLNVEIGKKYRHKTTMGAKYIRKIKLFKIVLCQNILGM